MISSWMKGLVIYLILSGLVMKLLPGKSYERYVSFYMGLILVVMLAKPVLLLFKTGEKDMDAVLNNVDRYLTFDGVYSKNSTDSYTNGTYYEMGFKEAVKKTCIDAGYDVSEASVITDKSGNVLSLTLYVKGETDENVLKKYIYDVYKIDFESIYIVRR